MTSRRFAWAALTIVAAVLSALLVPAPAGAEVGVDDYPIRLKTAGQDALVDPWNFYNRECTSFVAWRLNNDRDVAFHNYFLGVHWGNASNWGYAARKVGVAVDGVASVGSVAWWASGTPGSSRGHVAWVLDSSETAITIEEYNWVTAGRYSQRVIARTSSKWPSGFIHLNPPKMRATTPPSVVGTPQVGEPVVAKAGSWTPSGATYRYQWLADGERIAGATASTFTPPAELLGSRLSVRVRAAQQGVEATKVLSAVSRPVAPGVLDTSVAPAVVGRPRVGKTLVADPGAWSTEATYAYQWLADGVALPDATDAEFTPTADLLGHRLNVDVTATAPGFTPATVRSRTSWRVVPGNLATATPAIVGDLQVHGRLSVDTGTWSPAPEFSYQWLADGEPVKRGTGATYVPTRLELGKRLTVVVTGTAEGYNPATASADSPAAVALGELTATRPPAVQGTPQVGEKLTAQAPDWSPRAAAGYQWLADGRPIAGAHSPELTLSPALAGRQVSVMISGRRDGYSDAVATSSAMPVAKGVLKRLETPTVDTDAPRSGQTVTATTGRWSQPDVRVRYRWYADGDPVGDPESPRFVPTKAQLGKALTLKVIARAPGYRPDVTELSLGRILTGDTHLDAAPQIHGEALLGHTLSIRHGRPTPRAAAVTYRWFRDDAMIRGAHTDSYELQPADVGHRIWARARVRAEHWLPTRQDTARTGRVTSVPVIATRTTLTRRVAHVTVTVTARGINHPTGEVILGQHGRRVDRADVVDGGAVLDTGRLARGRHTFRVHYLDPRTGAHVRQLVVVQVP